MNRSYSLSQPELEVLGRILLLEVHKIFVDSPANEQRALCPNLMDHAIVLRVNSSPSIGISAAAIHGLYYAPIYAWLLLVSAWARRAAFLWAGLPLLAIGVVEKIAFNTTHFATMLGNRIGGGDEAPPYPMPDGAAMHHQLTLLNLGRFLVSPGLWIGLLLAAAFLAAAVRLRHSREPI